MRYRYYTGQRRDKATPDTPHGLHKAQSMIELLHTKYAETDKSMACTGCGGNKSPQVVSAQARIEMMSDANYVKAKYIGPGGNHHIIGTYQMAFDPGVPTRRVGNFWKHYYGYAGRGHVTTIHVEDLKGMIGQWERIPEINVPAIETPKPEPVPLIAPQSILSDTGLDLQTIPGVTDKIAKEMKQLGLIDTESISAYDLTQIKGVGEARAKMIKTYLADRDTG